MREKVDEALTVYDEYVRNAGDMSASNPETEGKTEETTTELESEPIAA